MDAKRDSVKELARAMETYAGDSAQAAAILKPDSGMAAFVKRLRPVHSCNQTTLLAIVSAKALKSRFVQDAETKRDWENSRKRFVPEIATEHEGRSSLQQSLIKEHLQAFSQVLSEFACVDRASHKQGSSAAACTACRDIIMNVAELAIAEHRLGPTRFECCVSLRDSIRV